MSKDFPIPTYPFKFDRFQIVTHQKTQGRYVIMELPNSAVLEETWEPAYGYVSTKGGPTIYRSQSKMEDGRFINHET